MPTFTCDLAAAVPVEHGWNHTVGSDHAPIALTADWRAPFRTCDAKLGFGMRPSSFMPDMLASGSTTVFRYRGNIIPPRDVGECAILIRRSGITGRWQ